MFLDTFESVERWRENRLIQLSKGGKRGRYVGGGERVGNPGLHVCH